MLGVNIANNQKGSLILLVGLVVALVGAVAFGAYQFGKNQVIPTNKVPSSNSPFKKADTPATAPIPTTQPTIDTSTWKTYSYKRIGLSITVPGTYELITNNELYEMGLFFKSGDFELTMSDGGRGGFCSKLDCPEFYKGNYLTATISRTMDDPGITKAFIGGLILIMDSNGVPMGTSRGIPWVEIDYPKTKELTAQEKAEIIKILDSIKPL